VLLLSPFVPHIAEELWQGLGHKQSLQETPWPTYDPAALKAEQVTIVVQINGKLRGKLDLSPEATEAEVQAAVQSDPKLQGHLGGKSIVKSIFVPGKLLNLVVK
jgi:leucyl-tRNA synthetase